ncbi:phosphopantetheine-binding protein, partial [Nocardia abscessus]|uniref:phosphopantetheine-binding protein n=1 Tax=Nocardia abscessus TaxID=120957 RepID=UPI003CC7D374
MAPPARAPGEKRPRANKPRGAGVFGDLRWGGDVRGAHDDFFELGGNSLIATQVAARLGASIGARVPARTVFEA